MQPCPKAPLEGLFHPRMVEQPRRETGSAEADSARFVDVAWADPVVAFRMTLLRLVHRGGRDLTARQLTAFMSVYLESHVHTVSSLADLMNISRPGVSRVIDRLAEQALVERQEDHVDRRRVLIRPTVHGAAFMRELNDMVVSAHYLPQP